MRHDVSRRGESQDAFTDLLFNALLGFAFMFVAAFALINEPEKPGNVEAKAEVLITVSWADHHPDDVDALVEDPRGNLVWYHNRDTGLMHLDRDDRGVLQDRLLLDGREVTNPLNQETVTVRALQAGEYVVNVLHYQANYAQPLPVTVKIEKLNPTVSLLYYGTVELTGTGSEQTAARFSIGAGGEVLEVSERPKRLLTRALGKS